MKILITLLFLSLSIGCTHISTNEPAPSNPLESLIHGKHLVRIEISSQYDEKKIGSISDPEVLNDFKASLATCTPMDQIDTRGSHHLFVYTSNGEVIQYDTDLDFFIRIPEWEGEDIYFESSPQLNALFEKWKPTSE
jgi:hypothetical protein